MKRGGCPFKRITVPRTRRKGCSTMERGPPKGNAVGLYVLHGLPFIVPLHKGSDSAFQKFPPIPKPTSVVDSQAGLPILQCLLNHHHPV